MNSVRRKEIVAGILIIIGMIAGILSIVPSVESPESLTEVAANQNQVLTGAFFQFMLYHSKKTSPQKVYKDFVCYFPT